jgi:hypothetical protein
MPLRTRGRDDEIAGSGMGEWVLGGLKKRAALYKKELKKPHSIVAGPVRL